jgi:uncharacterized protein (DUF4415 family)
MGFEIDPELENRLKALGPDWMEKINDYLKQKIENDVEPRKMTSMPLSVEVLDWFKADGSARRRGTGGWTGMVNRVLLDYVRAQPPRKKIKRVPIGEEPED